MLFYHLSAL